MLTTIVMSGFILGFLIGMIINSIILRRHPPEELRKNKDLKTMYGALNWLIAFVGGGLGYVVENFVIPLL